MWQINYYLGTSNYVAIKTKKARMPAEKQQNSPDICNTHWKKCNPRRLVWLFLSLVIIITDQLSKWFVAERIISPVIYGKNGSNFIQWYLQEPHMMDTVSIRITSFFNIVMAWNTGVSFSLFSNVGSMGVYLLIAIALLITMIFCYWLMRSTHWLYGLGYGLVIGGALGNVVDRLRFGAVIDFLDIHAYGYHWPAFNVADMTVVSGIGVLIIVSLFFDLEKE